MARAALRLSVEQAADQAGVGADTIRRMERGDGPGSRLASMNKLRQAYERLGVIFLSGEPGPAGVRYSPCPRHVDDAG